MDCLNKQIFEVTFKFERASLKRCFLRHNSGTYYLNTNEKSHNSFRTAQGTDARKLFDGNAVLSLDSLLTTVSITIDGSFPNKEFNVGKANLYKRSCDTELKFLETISKKSDNLNLISTSVLDLNNVHSVACTNSVIEFVMKVDLFYSGPIPNNPEVSKSFIDFENTKHGDTVVAVKDKQFKVCKAILKERSEVFEKMFSHTTTKESLEGIVKIEDFDPEVVKKFLIFMYSGMIFEDKLIPDLYLIADKYDVKELQEICWNKINDDLYLNSENISDVLVVAEKLGNEELKKKCFDYIECEKNFLQQAAFTPGWAKIIQEYPGLAEKIKEICISKKS